MLIIPAIDLKDGKCVRLRQGRMEDATVFSDDPVAMAGQWVQQGCRRLHLVDLNGAFAGTPVNADIVAQISAVFPDLPVQIGGGIRSLATIEAYLRAGVRYVILGTVAARDPDFVRTACQAFPGQIIVGIDARDGLVATEGWAEVGDLTASDLASHFRDAGVESIVYTDIARDGMMQGVNHSATAALARHCGLPIIASGGITNLADIQALLDVEDAGIMGAITGRAIYEGQLNLAEAQALCDARSR